jgi:hypothetical protein
METIMRIYTDSLADLLEYHVAYEMAGQLVRHDIDLDIDTAVVAALDTAEYPEQLIMALWPQARDFAREERSQLAALTRRKAEKHGLRAV